jgi:hypothetical protein
MTLTFASEQAVFDYVVKALIEQGRPAAQFVPDESRGAGGPETYKVQCRYRTSDGDKCAGGQVLPDEDYSPSMEGYGVSQILNVPHDMPGDVRGAKRLGENATWRKYPELVTALQVAHDNSAQRANLPKGSQQIDNKVWLDCFKTEARDIGTRLTLNTDAVTG